MMRGAVLWMYNVLQICSVIQHTRCLRLVACQGDMDAVELTEDASGEQTVCEDFAQDQGMEWLLNTTLMATCYSRDQACDNRSNKVFTATRGSSTSTGTFVGRAARPMETDVGYSAFQVTCLLVGGPRVTCPIDVVYVPSENEVSCSESSNNGTVTVSCTISKAYSARNRYTCDVRRMGSSGPSVGRCSYSSGTSRGYVSGSCSSSFVPPTSHGNASYSVIVYPGVREVLASKSAASGGERSAVLITCNDVRGYVAEATDLECTCTASDLGQGQGQLQVSGPDSLEVSGNAGEDNVVFGKSGVGRPDNGTGYSCVLGSDRSAFFTLKVAWGPFKATIEGDTTFYTDSAGTKSMTLTCLANDFHPADALTYEWNVPCEVAQQSTCIFRPHPPEYDNMVITCTVSNKYFHTSSRQEKAHVTLDLKYPPRSAPMITSSVDPQALLSNVTLTLTCNVTGGNPPVTSVTLTCPGRHEQGPTSGQSSTLVISPVTPADQGVTCECRGHWVNESYYPLFSTKILALGDDAGIPSSGSLALTSVLLMAVTLVTFLIM